MKKSIFLMVFGPLMMMAQTTQTKTAPDCVINFSFTSTGNSADLNNVPQIASGSSTGACSAWIVTADPFNSGAGTITFQSASTSNLAGTGPGTYATFGGTIVTGSNPTSVFPWTLKATGYYPWVRINASVLSAGTIRGSIQGWRAQGVAIGSGGGGGGSGYTTVESAGAALTQRAILNFVSGTTCVDNAGATRTDCTSSGGAAFYQTVEQSGTPLAQEPKLNFTGAGVSCVDNSGATSTDCTISGSGGAGNYSQTFTSQTTVALTHNLGSTAVLSGCYDTSTPPLQIIPNTTAVTSANTVTVTFLLSQSGYCVVNASGGGGGGGGVTVHHQYFTAAILQNPCGGSGSGATAVVQGIPATNLCGSNPMGIGGPFIANTQALIYALIPSTWDSSSITLTLDVTTSSNNTGNFSFAPKFQCVPNGTDISVAPTFTTGSPVVTAAPGGSGSGFYREAVALTVSGSGCVAGSSIEIAFVRGATDTYPDAVFMTGADLAIKY